MTTVRDDIDIEPAVRRDVAERVARIRADIAAAAARAGRDPAGITLLGACKRQPIERIAAALLAGLTDLGENRLNELEEHQEALHTISAAVSWHFIGALQSNKARRAAAACSLIHSVDRVSLARVLDRAGQDRGEPVRCLVEVNLAGETAKSGVYPADLRSFLRELNTLSGLCVEGLMAIPPPRSSAEASRADFRVLRNLLEDANMNDITRDPLRHLSMGMSADYPVAIEEGATIVRVGTALFGAR